MIGIAVLTSLSRSRSRSFAAAHDYMQGRITPPRFRTIQVCLKDLAAGLR